MFILYVPGNKIVPYESPRPTVGIHRFVFILFRQSPSRSNQWRTQLLFTTRACRICARGAPWHPTLAWRAPLRRPRRVARRAPRPWCPAPWWPAAARRARRATRGARARRPRPAGSGRRGRGRASPCPAYQILRFHGDSRYFFSLLPCFAIEIRVGWPFDVLLT